MPELAANVLASAVRSVNVSEDARVEALKSDESSVDEVIQRICAAHLDFRASDNLTREPLYEWVGRDGSWSLRLASLTPTCSCMRSVQLPMRQTGKRMRSVCSVRRISCSRYSCFKSSTTKSRDLADQPAVSRVRDRGRGASSRSVR